MEMREQLQYIDKLTNAIDRNDFESFQKIFNELQGNYINIAPLMLLENINHLIRGANNIKGVLATIMIIMLTLSYWKLFPPY
ncbi:hypothetical protein [Photorhabdus sp. RW14-46]|uniref:hypothetical protein n=1 Tax=Photorhabdus sp. RW14-46 TaxID=2100168 RepID=UPI0013F44DA5|nr:hypothetical protein [Photorhabdus sp. RW14-46]NHB61505.1 hypothetical protein [Photorhabdus sp. RW14-46]